MFRRLRARWVAGALTLALAGVGVVVVAGPASAEEFPFIDSFEGVPTTRWTPMEVAGQTTVRLGNDNRARNGTKVASLNAGPLFPSTAGVYRTVTPDATQPIPLTCTVHVYVRRVPNVPGPDPTSVSMQFKMRAGGPDGAVTLAEGRSFYFTDRWELWSIDSFWFPYETFTLEFTAYHGRALLDDLSFACYGP